MAEYSFAAVYDGPPLPFPLPRALPLDPSSFPLAHLLPDSYFFDVPVVAPITTPDASGRFDVDDDEDDDLVLPVVDPIASPEPRRELIGDFVEEEEAGFGLPVVEPIASPRKSGKEVEVVELNVSPTSVIGYECVETDGVEVSGEIGSSFDVCGGLDESEAVGFSSEFKESVDFSNETTQKPERVSTESALSSEFGFCSSGRESEVKRPALVTFEESCASEGTSRETGSKELGRKQKKGSCYRCFKGNRFTDKEVCIVCNAKYCGSCVLRSMGSMPEGRKCVSCIGYPIEELKREGLGKSSRLLKRLLSPLEVEQVMKAEKYCEANQLRSEYLCVNGNQLSRDEMFLLQSCSNPPTKLTPGHYWYDKVSGLWGKEGHKPHQIITPSLNVGGPLMENASNGNTGIFMNGREITKSEMRMLQWSGVQCAGSPHFWVSADGTYQEEGHNILKGNIWDKAGTKLICSILSLPVPPKTANSSVEEVNDMPTPGLINQRSLQKLLLVGCHESGTSTIFKQAKFLYNQPTPFSKEERENVKLMIQSNIYHYLGILLEGREQFEEESLAERSKNPIEMKQHEVLGSESGASDEQNIYSLCPRLKAFSDFLLRVKASGSLEAVFPAASREYAPLVEELWNDASIQATYRRINELQPLPTVASYFLERAVDISRLEYEPSDKDILYANGSASSNGLAYTEFFFPSEDYDGMDGDGQPEIMFRYQLIRVHTEGLGENRKCLEMFEDARMVIFCVALSEYNEYREDSNGYPLNKMLASKQLFESIATHPTFEQMDFLLVLNKFDVLEQKIEQAPLTLCDWFDDFNPVLSHYRSSNSRSRNSNNTTPAQQAFYYIAVKFKRLFTSLTGRKLYVTMANGLDRDFVDSALRYAREILKWEEERALLGGEFSLYSTEYSSCSD